MPSVEAPPRPPTKPEPRPPLSPKHVATLLSRVTGVLRHGFPEDPSEIIYARLRRSFSLGVALDEEGKRCFCLYARGHVGRVPFADFEEDLPALAPLGGEVAWLAGCLVGDLLRAEAQAEALAWWD